MLLQLRCISGGSQTPGRLGPSPRGNLGSCHAEGDRPYAEPTKIDADEDEFAINGDEKFKICIHVYIYIFIFIYLTT